MFRLFSALAAADCSTFATTRALGTPE